VVSAWLLALAVLGTLAIILVCIQKPYAPIKCMGPSPHDITICSMPHPDELFYQYGIISTIHMGKMRPCRTFKLMLLQVISLFLVTWMSFQSWMTLITNPLVSKFVFNGISYYVIVTTVLLCQL